MGQIDFNSFKQDLQNNSKNTNSNNGRSRVGFFSLKNDKDYALVRFMIDSPADFDIVAGHRMSIGGFNRMVSCIRDAHDPVDNCPLCTAGKKLEYRFYIHLIQYIADANGNLVPTPKVWERSTIYVNTFNNYLNDYGPLSDCLFKITRNGAAGSTKTNYDITFIPSTSPVYKPELYVKDTSLFEGYKAIGNAVVNYDYNKLVELASSEGAEEVTPRTTYASGNGVPQTPSTPNYQAGSGYGSGEIHTMQSQQVVPDQVSQAPTDPVYNTNRRFVPPANETSPNVNRPVRTY